MKNKIKFLAILGALAIFISFGFKPLNDKKTIVIDAGHGGKDAGSEVDGKLEKHIVESIANKLKALSSKEEVEIIFLRKGDTFVEISDRVKQINDINPSLMISLHVNASKNTEANGVYAYVNNQNDHYAKSLEAANILVDQLSKDNLAQGKIQDANFLILKNLKCPAMVLEVGFLTNDRDREYISSENGQNEIAARILEAIK